MCIPPGMLWSGIVTRPERSPLGLFQKHHLPGGSILAGVKAIEIHAAGNSAGIPQITVLTDTEMTFKQSHYLLTVHIEQVDPDLTRLFERVTDFGRRVKRVGVVLVQSELHREIETATKGPGCSSIGARFRTGGKSPPSSFADSYPPVIMPNNVKSLWLRCGHSRNPYKNVRDYLYFYCSETFIAV